MAMPVIGVIEWLTDKGASPDVIVGETDVEVRRAAVAYLKGFIHFNDDGSYKTSDIEYIDEEWLDDNPFPDLNDDAAVTTWLEAMREESTDAWFTVYQPPAEHRDGPPHPTANYPERYITSTTILEAAS